MRYIYTYRVRRFVSMTNPSAGLTRRLNFTTQIDGRVQPGYTFTATIHGKYGRYYVDSIHAVYADDGFCLVCYPVVYRSKSGWLRYLDVCQTYKAYDLVAELMQIGHDCGYIPCGSDFSSDDCLL